MSIKNTAKKANPEWLLGSNPGAIENQEKEGQEELSNSSQLPRTDGFKDVKSQYEKMGIKIVGESKEDELFYDVILPVGWNIVSTEHSMWSNLVNEKGSIVAKIFYKAAFYDRRADIEFINK